MLHQCLRMTMVCVHDALCCRSLFEKDKLLFAFLLAVRIMMGQKELDPRAYQFLLTGGAGVAGDKEAPRPSYAPDWLTPKVWSELCKLSSVSPGFVHITQDVAGHLREWAAIFDAVST